MACFSRTLVSFGNWVRTPRSYGTDQKIYPSEIHTLKAIVENPGANASSLSEIMSVTNGATTQVVSKLQKKGLIEKYYRSDNQKEVFYLPTEKGRTAYGEHEKFDELLYSTRFAFMRDMSRKEYDAVMSFLKNIEEGIR